MGDKIDWGKHEISIVVEYFFMAERSEISHQNAIIMATEELRSKNITVREYITENIVNIQFKTIEKLDNRLDQMDMKNLK